MSAMATRAHKDAQQHFLAAGRRTRRLAAQTADELHPEDEQQEKGAEEEHLERVIGPHKELLRRLTLKRAPGRRHKEEDGTPGQRYTQHGVEDPLAVVGQPRLAADHEKPHELPNVKRQHNHGARGQHIVGHHHRLGLGAARMRHVGPIGNV